MSGSSPPRPGKKEVSGSITSLLKDPATKEPVDKVAIDHFYKMALVPQIGNPRGPMSDYERIGSKKSAHQWSEDQYRTDVEYRKNL